MEQQKQHALKITNVFKRNKTYGFYGRYEFFHVSVEFSN